MTKEQVLALETRIRDGLGAVSYSGLFVCRPRGCAEAPEINAGVHAIACALWDLHELAQPAPVPDQPRCRCGHPVNLYVSGAPNSLCVSCWQSEMHRLVRVQQK